MTFSSFNKIVLCMALFAVGWMKFSLDGNAVYFADYVLRIILILILIGEIKEGFKKGSGFRFSYAFSGIFAFGLLTYTSEMLEVLLWDIGIRFPFHVTGFPQLNNKWLVYFDLTIGLILVAVTEEALFRVLFSKLAELRKWSGLKLYLWSSFWFALIRVPRGLGNTLSAFFFGLLFMYFYRKTGSFVFIVVIHFYVNLWIFGQFNLF